MWHFNFEKLDKDCRVRGEHRGPFHFIKKKSYRKKGRISYPDWVSPIDDKRRKSEYREYDCLIDYFRLPHELIAIIDQQIGSAFRKHCPGEEFVGNFLTRRTEYCLDEPDELQEWRASYISPDGLFRVECYDSVIVMDCPQCALYVECWGGHPEIFMIFERPLPRIRNLGPYDGAMKSVHLVNTDGSSDNSDALEKLMSPIFGRPQIGLEEFWYRVVGEIVQFIFWPIH